MAAGRGLLAAADLLWPKAEAELAALRTHSAHAALLANLRRQQRAGTLRPALESLLDELEEKLRQPRDGVHDLPFASAYQLLAGHAVENMLKGLRVVRLIAEGKTVGAGTGEDQIPFTTHRCAQFARVELGTLSPAEADVLERLGTFVTWAGRFPVSDHGAPSADALAAAFAEPRAVHALCGRIADAYESRHRDAAIAAPAGSSRRRTAS